jgi:hypothetical protein
LVESTTINRNQIKQKGKYKMSKFNAGTEAGYAELPFPVNYLYWKRGNAQMSHLKENDPAVFFGGWSASVRGKDSDLPALPLLRVTRTSDDGNTYERYSTNVLTFLPVTHRIRYELREKSFNPDGREVEKVVAVSREYISGSTIGYQPHKQVFGIVYSGDDLGVSAYAVLKINKWSSYISFDKAEREWMKVKVGDNQALVRRYGSIGKKTKEGSFVPVFEEFNQGRSTPIEAVGISSPIIINVNPELDTVWEQAQDWSKCERWNAAGKVVEHSEPISAPIENFGVYPDEVPF